MSSNWFNEFPGAITICDNNGIILDMNERAAATFVNDGGYNLIGKSLYDCHSDASGNQIKELINEKKKNVYTIEKDGVKKLIYQSPWYENGEMKGLIELSLEIPTEMPHHIRS